jgi:hypothetical protein
MLIRGLRVIMFARDQRDGDEPDDGEGQRNSCDDHFDVLEGVPGRVCQRNPSSLTEDPALRRTPAAHMPGSK